MRYCLVSVCFIALEMEVEGIHSSNLAQLTMSNILYAVQQQQQNPQSSSQQPSQLPPQKEKQASPMPSIRTDPQAPAVSDPLFMAARADIKKMLDILEHVGSGTPEMQKTRTSVLKSAFEAIA